MLISVFIVWLVWTPLISCTHRRKFWGHQRYASSQQLLLIYGRVFRALPFHFYSLMLARSLQRLAHLSLLLKLCQITAPFANFAHLIRLLSLQLEFARGHRMVYTSHPNISIHQSLDIPSYFQIFCWRLSHLFWSHPAYSPLDSCGFLHLQTHTKL